MSDHKVTVKVHSRGRRPNKFPKPGPEEVRYGAFSRPEDQYDPSGLDIYLLDAQTANTFEAGHTDTEHAQYVETNFGTPTTAYQRAITHMRVSAEDLSESSVEDMNDELYSQLDPDAGELDDLTVLADEDDAEGYRVVPSRWPIPHSVADQYGVSVGFGSVHPVEGPKWKAAGREATAELYGFVDYDPDAPPAAYTPRPVLYTELGHPDLPDPPDEGDFTPLLPFGSEFAEDYWHAGVLQPGQAARRLSIVTDDIFYEPFDTGNTTDYKVTASYDYDAAAASFPQLRNNEKIYVYLFPQNWKFDISFTGYVVFTWSSRDNPVHAFRATVATTALFPELEVGFPSGVSRGTIIFCQGTAFDLGDDMNPIREYTDESRGYYLCTAEPGFDVGDYTYIGGRAAKFYPEYDSMGNGIAPEHDISALALTPIPLVLQVNKVAQTSYEFSFDGYKKALTKPYHPVHVRRRTEPVNVLRTIGNTVAGHVTDGETDEDTGLFIGYGIHNGLNYDATTALDGYSPVGNCYYPNPESIIGDFDFHDWQFEDLEFSYTDMVPERHSANDLLVMAAWCEASVPYDGYFDNDFNDVWLPTSLHYVTLAQTVDASVNSTSTANDVRPYVWPSRPWYWSGPWVTSDALFTVTQVNTPAKTLVGMIAVRRPNGTVDPSRVRWVWRVTASTGRSTVIVDNQPFDSVLVNPELGTRLRSAAYGDYDPNGAIEFEI
jgi:hypothetical protein